MMNKYVTANLDLPSSLNLIRTIACSEEPVDFVFKGDSYLLLTAYIDGCETQYQLVLSQDGSWCMRTALEV